MPREKGKLIKCGSCGEEGHRRDSKKCPNYDHENPPKRRKRTSYCHSCNQDHRGFSCSGIKKLVPLKMQPEPDFLSHEVLS